MARTDFSLVVGVEFTNSVADDEDTLDKEMKDVKEALSSALKTRLANTFRGTVRVWIQRAEITDP